MKILKNKKGFTMVELLVVISIIALLFAAGMYALSASRMKGRDAKRKGDISGLDKAISMYINDNGAAPANTVPGTGECLSDTNNPGLALKTYMSVIPVDPRYPTQLTGVAITDGVPTTAPNGVCYYYYKVASGSGYKLSYILESNSSINTISR